jgi:undecaprenyl-diphosphatase
MSNDRRIGEALWPRGNLCLQKGEQRLGDYSVSFVLGVVEGLTEFVPVSSTAHLRLMQALLHRNFSDQLWKMYFIVIHLGALFALMLIYAQQLHAEAHTSPDRLAPKRGLIPHPPSLVGWAFLASVVPTYALSKAMNRDAASLTKIGLSLLVGGAVMWLADALVAKRKGEGKGCVTLVQAIWIGLCQEIAATFPGASRSMVTMVGGELAGLSRTTAVEFSFLLFVPSMLAAAFAEMLSASWRRSTPLVLDLHGFAVLGIGFCAATVMAYLSADWMLNWVERHGLAIFAAYRICLGLALTSRAFLH